MVRSALVLVPISLLGIGVAAHAEEVAKRQWRPVVASERHAKDAPATESGQVAPAQRAYVDPATGRLVSRPVVPPEPEVMAQESLRAARGKDRPLLRTPEGYLYIDTSDYRMTSTVHIGPDGQLHRNCVASHGDAAAGADAATGGNGE